MTLMIDPMGPARESGFSNADMDPDVLRALRDNRLVIMNGDFSVIEGVIHIEEVGHDGPVYGIIKNCRFRGVRLDRV